MYIDNNLLLADADTGTTSAASTSYIDTEAISIKFGDAYKAPWFCVKVNDAFTAGAGDPTATFQLQTSNDSSFLDSTTVTLVQSAALLAAALTEDTFVLKTRIPLGLKRYVRAYKVVDDGTGSKRFSAGTWSAFIAEDVDVNLP